MELNGKKVILAYADDIIMLGGTENGILSITASFISSSKKRGTQHK